jgi:hypothetical protein
VCYRPVLPKEPKFPKKGPLKNMCGQSFDIITKKRPKRG